MGMNVWRWATAVAAMIRSGISGISAFGARDFPDDEMADHLRTVHPEIDADGTRKSDNSRIVKDAGDYADS